MVTRDPKQTEWAEVWHRIHAGLYGIAPVNTKDAKWKCCCDCNLGVQAAAIINKGTEFFR